MIKKDNIYELVRKNTEYLYDKYNLDKYIIESENKEKIRYIIMEKLYELNLNICNQAIYNYTYTFTKDDMEFIEKYNLYDAIREIITLTLGKKNNK